MSLSNPRISNNPTKKYFNWRGSDGALVFYDKEAKANIEVPLPINFIVLDQLTTIKGFSDQYQGSFGSNEVRSTKDNLKVVCYGKNNKGEKQVFDIAEGSYESIKDKLKAEGAKYTKSVYAVLVGDDNQLELVNFQFSGSALKPFFDINASDDGAVIGMRKNEEEQKKGKTVYYEPEFVKLTKTPDNILTQAVALDKQLQEYLKSYFSKSNELEEVKEVVNEPVGVYTNELPDISEDEVANAVQMPF